MMLRVELRPLAASIVVVVRQLDPSQVPTVDSGVGHRAIRWYDLVVQCAVLLLAPPRVGRAEVVLVVIVHVLSCPVIDRITHGSVLVDTWRWLLCFAIVEKNPSHRRRNIAKGV